MKEFQVITYRLDRNMQRCDKQVYDIGEFEDIKTAYKTMLGNVLSQAPNGAAANKERHTISFLNGPDMVEWTIIEKEK